MNKKIINIKLSINKLGILFTHVLTRSLKENITRNVDIMNYLN